MEQFSYDLGPIDLEFLTPDMPMFLEPNLVPIDTSFNDINSPPSYDDSPYSSINSVNNNSYIKCETYSNDIYTFNNSNNNNNNNNNHQIYVQNLHGNNFEIPLNKQEIQETLPSSPEAEELNTSRSEYENHAEVTQTSLNLTKSKKSKVIIGDKPPESYADIIAKAIFASNQKTLQLKDIYDYVIKNYPSFTKRVETSKWKSAIRHNLSSQKFFIKTSIKNAQGHFWTLEENCLRILVEHKYTGCIKKTVKKFEKRQPKLKKLKSSISKSLKLNKDKLNSNPHLNETILAGSCLLNSPSKSPELVKEYNFNLNMHNMNHINNNHMNTYVYTNNNDNNSYNESAYFSSSNDNECSQNSFGPRQPYTCMNANNIHQNQYVVIEEPRYLSTTNNLYDQEFYYSNCPNQMYHHHNNNHNLHHHNQNQFFYE